MAVMALASCVKEESVPQNVICDSHERLTVYASTGNMSKTALDSEFNVLWSEGDKIKFVSADKSKEFTFTLSSGEGTTTGTFTLDEGQQVPADGSYIVYYPSTYDGSNYPVQKYLGDNVISGAPMKAEAKVENGSVPDLRFWNVGGILRYTIKGDNFINLFRLQFVIHRHTDQAIGVLVAIGKLGAKYTVIQIVLALVKAEIME